jgi:hypothetical protein
MNKEKALVSELQKKDFTKTKLSGDKKILKKNKLENTWSVERYFIARPCLGSLTRCLLLHTSTTLAVILLFHHILKTKSSIWQKKKLI